MCDITLSYLMRDFQQEHHYLDAEEQLLWENRIKALQREYAILDHKIKQTETEFNERIEDVTKDHD